jgi:hypothetical protein
MKISWPKHPVIYEINAWVWLSELSRKNQRTVNLATVPEQEWDALASYGFDAVWFMGVWERSQLSSISLIRMRTTSFSQTDNQQ